MAAYWSRFWGEKTNDLLVNPVGCKDERIVGEFVSPALAPRILDVKRIRRTEEGARF